MVTTVGRVCGGDEFTIYGDRYMKIDRDHPDCRYIGFSSRDGKAHGYAFRFSGGLVVEFPVNTPCEASDSERAFVPSPIAEDSHDAELEPAH